MNDFIVFFSLITATVTWRQTTLPGGCVATLAKTVCNYSVLNYLMQRLSTITHLRDLVKECAAVKPSPVRLAMVKVQ